MGGEACPETQPGCDPELTGDVTGDVTNPTSVTGNITNPMPMSGASYCTYSPDYSCYLTGWPSCCDSNGGKACPQTPPEKCEIDVDLSVATGVPSTTVAVAVTVLAGFVKLFFSF